MALLSPSAGGCRWLRVAWAGVATVLAVIILAVVRVDVRTWMSLTGGGLLESQKLAAIQPCVRGDVSVLPHRTSAEGLGASSDQELAAPVLWMNDYRPVDYAVMGLTLEEACQKTAGNVGNLVWMEGASALLANPLSRNFIHSSFGDKNLEMHGAKAFIFPVANILANRSLCDQPVGEHHFSMMQHTLRAIRSVEGPTVLIGVGTQAYFGIEHKAEAVYYDLQPGSITATPKSYRMCELDQDVLRVIQERRGTVLARGAFTTEVLHAHGFTNVINAGCPSLFSNRDPGLGRQIQERIQELRRRLESGTSPRHLRVAVNLPPYFKPKLAKLFLQILRANPNNRLVLQDHRDERVLEEAEAMLGLTVSKRQKTFFTSVAAWKEFMSQFDFVLGGRIHGTMMGLSVRTPVFVIAPDWRVLEMAEAMLIPVTSVFDRRLLKANISVADLINMAAWDGPAFDRNRCLIYQRYLHVFQGARLALHPQLAKLCEEFPGVNASGDAS